MDELIEKLLEHKFLDFFNEPIEIHKTFIKKKADFIDQTIQNLQADPNNEQQVLNLSKAILISMLLSLLSGDFTTYIDDLNLLDRASKINLPASQQKIACEYLGKKLSPTIAEISLKIRSATNLHNFGDSVPESCFHIAKFNLFESVSHNSTSITTDGKYLYLYISASNGGMYKIGTGHGRTIEGKVYLEAPVSGRQENISWIY